MGGASVPTDSQATESTPVTAAGGAREPLVVLHVLPDLAVGGGQVLLLRHIAARSPRVTHHVAYVRDQRDMLAQFEAAGATCHLVESRGGLGFRACGARLAALAKEVRADLIHTNNTGLDRRPGMIAARRSGIPLVNTIHAEGGNRFGGSGLKGLMKGLAQGWEDRLAQQVTRGVIAVSAHVRDCHQARLGEMGIEPSRVHVIHPGLDLEAFDQAAAPGGADGTASLRAELLRGRGGPLLVHVGRLAEGKGHGTLLRVLPMLRAEFPEVVMLCVGEGPLRPELEKRAQREGLAHSFTFAGDRADVPAILRASDLMLFPSESEGFGLAPLEAMAAGLPVVSTKLPSVLEFLNGGGVTVPLRDERAMADEAAQLLRDEAARLSMGAAGRRHVEAKYRVQRFVAEHEALYQAVVREHRRGGSR